MTGAAVWMLEGQFEPERAAVVDFAVESEAAAHQLHELTDDRESEASAPEPAGRGGVGLGERFEHATLVFGCDPDAGVGDFEANDRSSVVVRDWYGPEHDFAFGGELHGVGDKIDQYLAKAGRIATDHPGQVRVWVGEQLELLVLRCVAEERGDVFEEYGRFEVDDLQLELAGFDLGEVQDVVDDREESFTCAVDAGCVLVLFAVERGREEELAEADDGVHRCADLVAHRREEFGLQAGCFHRGVACGGELFCSADPLGDVACVDDEPADCAVGEEVADGAFHRDPCAVAVTEPEGQLDGVVRTVEQTCEGLHDVRFVARVEQLSELGADDLARFVAEHPDRRRALIRTRPRVRQQP